MIDLGTAIYLTEKTIELSPKIAQAAEGLWNKVKRKSPSSVQETGNSINGDIKQSTASDISAAHTISVETAIRDLQNEMLASADLLKALADQQAHLVKLLEANGLRIESLESQNSLLLKRLELDGERLAGLEAQCAQLAKDVEVERSRTGRLISACIAIGLMAVAGLAMALRTAMQ
jgi:hypothetical protein